jgi:PIN domain nuclease of toxin-antitoxin system
VTSLVLDTHAIIWYLDNSPRLSQTAGDAIQDAIAAALPVFVSAISIVEITYLVEKGRLTASQLANLLALLRNPNSGIRVAAIDLDVSEHVAQVPRDQVPDLPDRIIGATALQMGLPLVTSDSKLQASGITTVW